MSGPLQRDWLDWHDRYDDAESPLVRRLQIIQGQVRTTLASCPPGPIHAISMCAGQGRDLIKVLASDPRRDDVTARLVELDTRNAQIARRAARAAGLFRIEVTEADAGITDAYAGAVPAQLLLLCGVFGNIADADVERTVRALPSLCSPAATVIWTRHREAPDLTPAIRRWFDEAGFSEVAFDAPEVIHQTVVVHRLISQPTDFQSGEKLFTFIGFDNLP